MAIEILHDFVFPAVLVILTAIMGYIVWLLQQQRAEAKENAKVAKKAADSAEAELLAIKSGNMLLLRRELFEYHRRFCVEGETMDTDDYAHICEVFDVYTALGGNGVAKKAFKELEQVHLS